MRTECIITKNPVCLEWFMDKRCIHELCLTFGDYTIELCTVSEHVDGMCLINAIHDEMITWDNNEFPSLEDALHQATAAAFFAFGLEEDCRGKDAVSAYMNKEKRNATH